jgi:hypothetical protein
MDDDEVAQHEAAQHEAEDKAAALHYIGALAAIWAQAVRDVLALHESARERFAANDADLESWMRLHGSALMLAVAIDQVRVFERRVRRLTGGDPELAESRARFDHVSPDSKALRDLVAHLDAYAVGEGWRQTGDPPELTDRYLETFLSWPDDGSTLMNLGDSYLNLRRAADAATDLATVVERVRARHLARVEKEANAAMRRRFGLPPEDE